MNLEVNITPKVDVPTLSGAVKKMSEELEKPGKHLKESIKSALESAKKYEDIYLGTLLTSGSKPGAMLAAGKSIGKDALSSMASGLDTGGMKALETSRGQLGKISSVVSEGFKGVAKGFAIVGALYAAFEPALEVMQTVGRMLSTLIRPLVDAALFVVMPLIHMMRPIVQVFHQMITPFREIAMRGSAAAGQLMGKGMQLILGGETEAGNKLLGEGTKGALASAGLMLTGFTQILFEKPLNAIGGLFKNSELGTQIFESASAGYVRIIAETELFASGIRVLEETVGLTNESVGRFSKSFDILMIAVQDKMNGLSIDNYKTVMEGIVPVVDATAGGVAAVLSGDESSITEAVVDLTTAAMEANISLPLLIGNVQGLAEAAVKANAITEDLALAAISDEYHLKERQMTIDHDPGKGARTGKMIGTVAGMLLPGSGPYASMLGESIGGKYDQTRDKKFTEDITKLQEERNAKLKQVIEQFHGKEVSMRETANASMLTTATNAFSIGVSGTIPTTYKDSVTEMTTQTKNFATSAGGISKSLQAVNDIAKRAIAEVDTLARRLASALERARKAEQAGKG